MIFYFGILRDNPAVFFVLTAATFVVIATAIAFHEFSHAWMANELGDDTAKRQGRLTLNPLVHVQPVMLLIIALFGLAMGATPVRRDRLKYGPVRGGAIVAFAGPASNFFFAAMAALPVRIGLLGHGYPTDLDSALRNGQGRDLIVIFLFFVASRNILLGLVNLIPIPPLDGFSVFVGVIPRSIGRELEKLAPWGPGILMSMFAISIVTPFSPFSFLIGGLDQRIYELLVT